MAGKTEDRPPPTRGTGTPSWPSRSTGHRFDYYVLDAPTVTDAEYDRLMRELQALEDGVPGAAHARLADPEGRRHVLDRVHRGRRTSSGC